MRVCLIDIAMTIGIDATEYTKQLKKDPVALADRLAEVEINPKP